MVSKNYIGESLQLQPYQTVGWPELIGLRRGKKGWEQDNLSARNSFLNLTRIKSNCYLYLQYLLCVQTFTIGSNVVLDELSHSVLIFVLQLTHMHALH